ncbi:MAG: hypothetical protein QM811_21665 [Pirellulales bacterium]
MSRVLTPGSAQSRRIEFGRRVALLGDDANRAIGICEHHDRRDPTLQADIAEFHTLYRHLSSSQQLGFERFCIERWFLVRNFMRRERLARCLVIDSDVLLFCDVPYEAHRLREFAMTFARWDAVRRIPHCNFIGSLAAIEDFCAYVLETYRDPDRLAKLRNANLKKRNQDWISDMSLFYDWGSRATYPVALIDQPQADEVFDAAIDDVQDYVPAGYLPGLLRRWKKIEFRDGRPYAFSKSDGRAIRMKCLHYHGPFKTLMTKHAQGQSEGRREAFVLLGKKLGRWPSRVAVFCRNYVAPRFRPRGASPGDQIR